MKTMKPENDLFEDVSKDNNKRRRAAIEENFNRFSFADRIDALSDNIEKHIEHVYRNYAPISGSLPEFRFNKGSLPERALSKKSNGEIERVRGGEAYDLLVKKTDTKVSLKFMSDDFRSNQIQFYNSRGKNKYTHEQMVVKIAKKPFDILAVITFVEEDTKNARVVVGFVEKSIVLDNIIVGADQTQVIVPSHLWHIKEVEVGHIVRKSEKERNDRFLALVDEFEDKYLGWGHD